MFFRRAVATMFGVFSLAVLSLALTGSLQDFPKNLNPFTATSAHSITGAPGVDGPLLVVKIDDTRPAHPQIGVESADIVYIEQVEGGLTRLAAIFSSQIPQRIGPVRSARISDIELLDQYGRVAFAYSGAQRKMRPVIEQANVEDLGAQSQSSTIYTTDTSRTPPYAMVLRADLLMDLIDERSLPIANSKPMGWNFGDTPQDGRKISAAHISWPASSYDARWSEKESRWLLDYLGEPNLSDAGIHLGPATFVIQLVTITDSIYKDKVGGVTPFSATVGKGRGYILRDGRAFKAQWSRPDSLSGTEWRLENGEEITFARGQIWVALTDKEPEFTLEGSDAGMKSSK